MFDASMIRKSGQWWKAVASFWLLMFGALVMAWGLTHISIYPPDYVMPVVLAGICLAALGFAFACLAIRCPSCGARWVWMGVSGKSSGQWLSWLLSQSKCPACGSDAQSRAINPE